MVYEIVRVLVKLCACRFFFMPGGNQKRQHRHQNHGFWETGTRTNSVEFLVRQSQDLETLEFEATVDDGYLAFLIERRNKEIRQARGTALTIESAPSIPLAGK